MDAQVVPVVVAHLGRVDQADNLMKQLPENARCFMDSGFLGEWKNHRRALEWGWAQDVSHVVVLQDDAVLVDGFMDHVQEAASRRPEDLFGLYVGTGRPHAAAVLGAVDVARRSRASWIVTDGLIWGVGIVFPVKMINPFLTWCARTHSRLPYDQRITAWCRETRTRVSHTWPSLVDHADVPSVIKGRARHLETVRVAHEWGVPNWNDVEVNMLLHGSTLRP